MNKKMIGKLVGVLFFLEALFMLPAIAVCFIYGETGAPLRGFLWTVALLLALLTAGSYAELVTKYPKAGGAAIFAERAFKLPVVSFLVGF